MLTTCQRHSSGLAGLSYAEIAAKLGPSKGRVGQITLSAPPGERAVFGERTGVFHHFDAHAAEICRVVGREPLSMVVRSTVDETGNVIESDAICPPGAHASAS